MSPAAIDQYSGVPRSLIWRGGAAHLRSGGSAKTGPDLHSHFAIQLTVGLRDQVSLRSSRRAPERLGSGWLVGSDQPHWAYSCGPAVTIFLDPLSGGGQRLAALLNGAAALAIVASECGAVRHGLQSAWEHGWRVPEVREAAARMVDLLAPATAAVPPDAIDPRVRTVVDALVQDSSENVALAELAAGVGLSEGRLAHLFRRDVGIPMRQYRLSLRMEQAVARISQGSSLTEAAHMAGFADSAHFCRVCRRMYGTAPSNLPDFETEK